MKLLDQPEVDFDDDLHEDPRVSASPPFIYGVNIKIATQARDRVDLSVDDDGSFTLSIRRFATGVDNYYDQQNVRIANFLDSVYSIYTSGNERIAIDYLIDHMDSLLNNGRLLECAKVFDQIDASKLSDAILVSFLGITSAAKSHLRPARDRFYDRARSVIAERRTPEGADRLLTKYK